MSTLIDQRILIPAPTYAIWAVLADANQLPSWRIDCQKVEILTARQFGVGMRCRCTPPRGKPKIEEMLAWYEGLGYEYQVVENRAYRSYVGRLRLQAVPEGTIVQWTITYEPKGLLSRLMNKISGRAQLEEDCADSLRQLYRVIQALGYGAGSSPEARKRQTLQPVQSIVRSSTQPIVVPAEEAAADTKPRKPEGLAEAIAAKAEAGVPYATTQPAHGTPATAPTDLADVLPATPPPPVLEEELPPGMPEHLKVTPPQGIPKVDLSRVRYADEVGAENDLAPADEDLRQTQLMRPGLPPPTSKDDTGEISIWDAFGIKPPSRSDAEALDVLVKTATGPHKAISPEHDEDTAIFSPLSRAMILRVRVPHDHPPRSRAAPSSLKVRLPNH